MLHPKEFCGNNLAHTLRQMPTETTKKSAYHCNQHDHPTQKQQSKTACFTLHQKHAFLH